MRVRLREEASERAVKTSMVSGFGLVTTCHPLPSLYSRAQLSRDVGSGDNSLPVIQHIEHVGLKKLNQANNNSHSWLYVCPINNHRSVLLVVAPTCKQQDTR